MLTKILKSIMAFNESERLAPRFILTYVIIWCLWHSQVFTTFMMTSGDFLARADATLIVLESNQYLFVFFLTCLFFAGRIGYFVLKHKADELLEQDSEMDLQGGSDQRFAKADDVQRLMEMISLLKTKLADSQQREDKANTDKKLAMTKQINLQFEMDELKADIALLQKTNDQLQRVQHSSAAQFELSESN